MRGLLSCTQKLPEALGRGVGILKSHLQKRVLEILVCIIIEALSSSIDFQRDIKKAQALQDDWIRIDSFDPFRGIVL
jgi:hypothetical protein